MAYIFHEDELPKLVSAVPGRERTFFVNKELTNIDDMLAGIMRYKQGAASPLHLHENCEHFYFIMEGKGSVETPEGIRDVNPGDLVFIPAEATHRLRATESPLFYFEFQAPNRFVTTILDGTPDDLKWNRVDGRVWGPNLDDPNLNPMPKTLFIDTNKLPRVKMPQGEATEILNEHLAGAKNVLGTLRWLKSGEKYKPDTSDKHQLLYLMEGKGSIHLEDKDHEVSKGMGVYLGPSETATIQATSAPVKIFHLVVPQIPK